jgi:N-methylhydantoinase A
VGIRVGIDTGGTFTDLVAVDEDSGRWHLAKVPTDPDDPVGTVAAALEAADFEAAEVNFVVVGTTLGINAVLTRKGARVVYLTTKGFEDIPFIQRISRKYHYDYTWRKPKPLVHRLDCVGVPERMDEEGKPIMPLGGEQLERALASRLEENGVKPAIAVCYLFSYLNPEHELATAAILRDRFPDLSVSLSHDVAPIWREYERGTTAIVDAYLKPLLHDYVTGVSKALEVDGVSAPWALLKSNGGHALSEQAHERPAHLLLSGIAGGAIGGAYFARARSADKGIVLDMGGTSCDVCLIVDGEALYSSDYEIEYGLPVSVPTVSTKTIGAGGGSIGWVDPGGFLQVGPQSAGASPGPACYGQGGADATITDANVALGRLNPDFFLGGRLKLDPELSLQALERLGSKLGVSGVEVASSMVKVANENMANAIRIVTVEQGIDPREFELVAFGGAGPTHGAEIADAIGIERVIVPVNPGLCSAFGTIAAQVRVDAVKSISLVAERTTGAELDRLFRDLEEQAQSDFVAQGAAATSELRRSIAMRYQGQNYEQEIPVPGGAIDDATLETVVENYHRLHEDFYGYRFEGIPVELVRISVVVAAEEPALPAMTPGTQSVAPADGGERDVYYPGHGFLSTPVVRIERVEPGERPGPLVVESMDSTIVVPPHWTLRADPTGIVELYRLAGPAR